MPDRVNYDYTQFQITNPDAPPIGGQGGAALADQIFRKLQEILNNFKVGVVDNKQMLDKLKKIATQVDELMNLVNALGESLSSMGGPSGWISSFKAQIAKTGDLIKDLGNAKYEALMNDALDQIKALLTNKQVLSSVIDLEKQFAIIQKDLQAMYNGTPKVDGMALIKAVLSAESDLAQIQILAQNFQHIASSNPGSKYGLLATQLNLLYDVGNAFFGKKGKFLKIRGVYVTSDGGEWSTDIGKLISNYQQASTPEEKQQWEDNINSFFSYTPTMPNNGFHVHLVKVALADSQQVENLAASINKGFPFSEKEEIQLLNDALTSRYGLTAQSFPNLYDAYRDAMSGTRTLYNSATQLSNQTVSNVSGEIAAMNAVFQTFTKEMNVPIQLVNFSMQQILKRR